MGGQDDQSAGLCQTQLESVLKGNPQPPADEGHQPLSDAKG